MMTAQCLMVNCRNKAPDGEAMCSKHRSDHKGVAAAWYAGFEAGAKAMQEAAAAAVDSALIVFAIPDANTSPDAMYSAGVRAIAALDPAQIAGGKP